MQGWGASQEGKASLEGVADSPLEGEETEVSAAKDNDKAFSFQSVRIPAENFNYPITALHLPTKRDFVGY